MFIKSTILYDFTTQKIINPNLQLVNVKHTKNISTYNICEYEVKADEETTKLAIPYKTGVFCLNDNNNIVCGGLLLSPFEKDKTNNTSVFQTFTAIKLLENTPWIGETKNIINRDFLYYARLLRDQIKQHNTMLATALTTTISKQTNNPHCSFTDPQPLQQGTTLNLLEVFNMCFTAGNMGYEDGWTIQENRIIPTIEFKSRNDLKYQPNMLLDDNVNIIDIESSYKGEYGNAVMVLGSEKDNDTTHKNPNLPLPPFHAIYNPSQVERITKWVVISDRRLKSNETCLRRAKYEHSKAVTRLDIDSVTVVNHGFANIYDIKLLDVLKTSIKGELSVIRVDSLEYDYGKDAVKIVTHLVENTTT